MNHLFKPTAIPEYIKESACVQSNYDSCKICERCGLKIYYNVKGKYCRFYNNDIEIYKNIVKEIDFKFNCDEFIIKNIIE